MSAFLTVENLDFWQTGNKITEKKEKLCQLQKSLEATQCSYYHYHKSITTAHQKIIIELEILLMDMHKQLKSI